MICWVDKMILKGRIKKVAELQDCIIFSLNEALKDYLLIFHGGTCIWRIYNSNRLSYDLDFWVDKLPNEEIENFVEIVRSLGKEIKIMKKRRTKTGRSLFLRISIDRGEMNVEFTILDKEKRYRTIVYEPIANLPRFTINVLEIEELILEKIFAVINRYKVRDLYDLFFLLSIYGKKFKIDEKIFEKIEKKLENPPEDYEELKSLIIFGKVPRFEDMVRTIWKFLKE